MSKLISVEMQERGLGALVRNGGFQFTPTFFPYTSGEIGPYYVQSGDVMKNGADYAGAIDDMTTAVQTIFPAGFPEGLVIAGGETRDWIFSNPVAKQLGLPPVMIYKDGKTVGASMKGKPVLPIADLNNEGSSPRDLWAPAINAAGGVAKQILFYVDRMEAGVGVMKQLGLESYAAVPLNAHAWDYLMKMPNSGVSEGVYKQLMARMEDKDAWARKMLRYDAGLETLAALLASAKSREKGLKILNVGYPDMKEELGDRLETRFGFGLARLV
jgi:orotate phosphoribosyltransferase